MKYFIDTEFLEGAQDKTILGIKYGKTKPTIDLISIGMVSEDNREYHAISKDFNLKEAWNRWQQRTGEGDRNNIQPRLYWLRDNVLKPIYKELHSKENLHSRQAFHRANVYIAETKFDFSYKDLKRLIKKYGKTNKQIAKEIRHFVANRHINANKEQWILDYDTKDVQFYGYYCDYDWVAFCWLFGKMMDLPKGFPMYCIDLKQELDRKANSMTTMEITEVVYGKGYMKHDVFKYADEKYPEFNVTKINSLMKAADYSHPELKQTNEHSAICDARFNYNLYKFLQTI